MAKGLVVNVVAGAERYTEVFTRDRIRIGTQEDCDLQLTAQGLPEDRDAALELERLNGAYYVSHIASGWRWLHNGHALQFDALIADGDQITLDLPEITLQFFPVGGLPAVLPALRHSVSATSPAQMQARHDEAKVFLRDFTRELISEINPLTKILSLLLLVLAVGGLSYLIYSFYNELQRNRAAAERSQDEINTLKKSIEEFKNKIDNIGVKTDDLAGSASLPFKVRNDYGNGVCLIYGLYHYVDLKTGKPLRYPQTPASGVMTEEDGSPIAVAGDEAKPYVLDGNGPIAEFETIGTGFHVGDGFILTNKHVVQPWRNDKQLAQLKSLSATARLKRLIVYFPDRPQPLTLAFRQAAAQEDVAVCRIENMPDDIPTLPLDSDAESIAVGRIVALMGYPNGPNRLIAKLEEPDQQKIQQRCGGTQGSLVGCLAEKGLIKPLTTQGTITDIDLKRLVYDARTAEGGSGSPLFGQSGRVIGINFGIYAESEASNFAVPIRYGLTLLQRNGWPVVKKDNDANAAASPTPGPANANVASSANNSR